MALSILARLVKIRPKQANPSISLISVRFRGRGHTIAILGVNPNQEGAIELNIRTPFHRECVRGLVVLADRFLLQYGFNMSTFPELAILGSNLEKFSASNIQDCGKEPSAASPESPVVVMKERLESSGPEMSHGLARIFIRFFIAFY